MMTTLQKVAPGDLIPDSVEAMDAEAGGSGISAEMMQQMCDDGSMDVYIASEKSRDVGFACVVRVDGTARIVRIVTDKRLRKWGVGSFVLSTLRRTYRDCNLTAASDENLVPFFLKNGFNRIDVGDCHVLSTRGYDEEESKMIDDVIDTYRRTRSETEIGEEVSAINSASFGSDIRSSDEILQAMIDEGLADVITCRENGKVTGFACVLDGGNTSYLLYLAVSPECRGRGVGSRLIMDVFNRRPGKNIFLDCESNLIPYYNKLGFTDTGYVIRYCGHDYHYMDLTGTMMSDGDFLPINIRLNKYDKETAVMMDSSGNEIELEQLAEISNYHGNLRDIA